MREPRDLSHYDKPENIAVWLEGLANDIRSDAGTGKMMRVELTLKAWHPSWKTTPKRRRK